MPFRFRGVEKRDDLKCFIVRCGKTQEFVEGCTTVVELRAAARERVRDDDDDVLMWAFLLHCCKQPKPMEYFKSLEGKRISFDFTAAIKIEDVA